ncbi:MAG: hypothetical protein AB7V77_04095 [Candidatus Woesearchaeota archaeon]
MKQNHRKKLILSFLLLIFTFTLIIFFSLFNLKLNKTFLNIGLSSQVENLILIILSLSSIIKIIFELKQI